MQSWLGLNRNHLTQVDENHWLHKDVVAAYLTLQKQAHDDGIDLQLFSSFRDFERQSSIWDRKWNGELPILSAKNQRLDISELTDTEKMHAILLWSALPGASRHHWGTDIDVYDKTRVAVCNQPFQLVDDEYKGDGPCAALSAWLDEHAETLGFYRPYAKYAGGIGAEPWHISCRAVAEGISSAFDQDQLRQTIAASNLAGRATILQHFDEIYYRYVMNHGIPTL